MKRIMFFLFLISNGVLASVKVPLLKNNFENLSLVDSLLGCCEQYMLFEYGSSEMYKKNYCHLSIVGNGLCEYIFSIQNAFTEETPLLQNINELVKNERLYFYKYDSMYVLIENWNSIYKSYSREDSVDIFTSNDVEIYLQVEFAEIKNALKVVDYNNYKCILESNEGRIFRVCNDTCFNFGESTAYPFEILSAKDTSFVNLDYKESWKYWREKNQ